MRDSAPDAPGSTGPDAVDRRTVLAAGAGVATASLAGCSAVVDFLAGFALDDVNVFNTSEENRTGRIEVADPDGETVLDEQFDLVPEAEADDENESGAVYGDVLDGSGEYTVAVELEDEIDPDGSDSDGANPENGSTETGGENGTTSTDAVNDGGGAGDENGSNGSAADADDGNGDGEVTAVSSVEETVEVSNPDEEHVAVILGADDADGPIQVVVIEEFSDLADYLGEA